MSYNSEENDGAQHQQQQQSLDNIVLPLPKHIPFPEYPASSELLNELIMFLFTTCTAAMQFINIYRTNWWMPESNITNVVNLQHIDRNLLWLIFAMNSRRLLYCLGRRYVDLYIISQRSFMHWCLKYGLYFIVMLLPITALTMVYSNRNYLTLFLLFYPFIIYFLFFGFALEPFLRFNYDMKGPYFNGYPMHSCSANPNDIRSEIDVLCNDLNSRCKQVIFTALLNAYYSAFLPCYFAQYVHYNVRIASFHCILVFLSVYMLSTTFTFSSKYCDILHRAALHLGILKTLSIPLKEAQNRFYRLFNDPSKLYKALSMFQLLIIISCIALLSYTIEWNFVLSLSFIALTNQFTWFKIERDYLIAKNVYMTESSVIYPFISF